MNEPPLLAIILNWRQPALTIECVKTLQQSTYPNLKIMVIDNGSGDESVSVFQQSLPDTIIVPLPENLGFARGCNIGLRWAQEHEYKWALLLNNDAFVTPTMVEQLMAETAADIGLLSPKIFYQAQPEYIWFAGAAKHPRLLEMRETGQGERDGSKWQKTRDVDYLVGTSLLVNVTAVSPIGLFDEKYFMYYEDLDWSIRLRQAGLRLRLVANAHVYHQVSFSSGGQSSPSQLYHQAKSSAIFFYLHAQEGQPLLILLFRSGSALKKIGRLLWQRQISTLLAYIKGLQDGWHIIKKG